MGFTAINTFPAAGQVSKLSLPCKPLDPKASPFFITHFDSANVITNPYGLARPEEYHQSKLQRLEPSQPQKLYHSSASCVSQATKTHDSGPTTGKRNRAADQVDNPVERKRVKRKAEAYKRSPWGLDRSQGFHWREVSSGASFARIAGPIVSQREFQTRRQERDSARPSRETTISLLRSNCDCPDCTPSLYDGCGRDTPCTSKKPLIDNSPAKIASLGVRLIESRSGLAGFKTVQRRWRHWDRQNRNPGIGESVVNALPDLSEVTDIFSDLFFAGKLPRERVITIWARLDSKELGCTKYLQATKQSIAIELNADYKTCALTRQRALETLLHEMVHAFLMTFCLDPRKWNKCPDSHFCRRHYDANVGPCHHGRAWQSIAKAIEDASLDVLGFRCEIGRGEALWSHVRGEGAGLPCVREARRLYPWLVGTPHLRCRDYDRVCFKIEAHRDRRVIEWAPWKIDKMHSRRRKSI